MPRRYPHRAPGTYPGTRIPLKGFSDRALARELDVSRQTINSIETGRYTSYLQLAIAIARFFGTTVEEIFHADHT